MWHGHPARVSHGRPRPCLTTAPPAASRRMCNFLHTRNLSASSQSEIDAQRHPERAIGESKDQICNLKSSFPPQSKTCARERGYLKFEICNLKSEISLTPPISASPFKIRCSIFDIQVSRRAIPLVRPVQLVQPVRFVRPLSISPQTPPSTHPPARKQAAPVRKRVTSPRNPISEICNFPENT